MALTPTITCDICGKQKQATNHWWMFNGDDVDFMFNPWDDDLLQHEGWQHVCGQECAVTALSKWMQEVHAPQK